MLESLMAYYTGGRILSISFLFYFLDAFSFYTMAQKANVRNAWIAFIPILQFILFFHMIDKSAWHMLLLLIPFVNFILIIVWSYDLYLRFGIETGVAALILILNFLTGSLAGKIFQLYLAFSDKVNYIASNRYTDYEY